jgi:hypothetical protein
MADSQTSRTRRTRDTKATRPSPMPGLSEAEFDELAAHEAKLPEAQRSPVIARIAAELKKQQKKED